MQAYLADKYMSGPKAEAILARTAPKKAKKREATAGGPSMLIDDDAGFGDEASRQRDKELDASEAVVASDRTFKKRRTAGAGAEGSGWATVREGVREESPPPAADEQPVVVVEKEEAKAEAAQPAKGGLLTSGQLRGALAKPAVRVDAMSQAEIEAAQETVYRDASGRKVDVHLARAEAARKKREREELEARKMQWGRGLVQREEEEQRRLQLAKNGSAPFSRHADDKELNEELKAQERWNDPAAAFLTKQRARGPRMPEYKGPPPPPNRFGIKPGHRWDGVDRSNGFEGKLFQRQNERQRMATASYEWSVDDM